MSVKAVLWRVICEGWNGEVSDTQKRQQGRGYGGFILELDPTSCIEFRQRRDGRKDQVQNQMSKEAMSRMCRKWFCAQKQLCRSYFQEGLLIRLVFGQHLGTWILSIPNFTLLISMVYCDKLVQKMRFMLNTCFPCGSLEFWYLLSRECLYDQHPNLGPGVSNGLP